MLDEPRPEQFDRDEVMRKVRARLGLDVEQPEERRRA
jgi:hypothetical protein